MKKLNKLLCAVVVLFLLIALLPTTTTEAATNLQLNKTKVTLCVGQTTKLKVTNSSSKITWTSSNKKIATVSSSGKVTGKKVGTCTITATVGKKTVKCKVTVAKHKWVEVEETGHYEQVQIGTRKAIKCKAGHGPFYTNEEWQEHEATSCMAGSTIYSEPVYETQWVVEQTTSKCARCNSTK